ncbi:hypothetical protein QJS04_geneDACA024031 [Acorus gramineus]|uniref:Uncharacterized protein n=1 Tax=Acorus gramineus TaxID=55184 RepID=A0AAV8ZZD6_ACOGR|nr:hypothetical protein QJS04_geneDACA024031 [Acorus gramineus]
MKLKLSMKPKLQILTDFAECLKKGSASQMVLFRKRVVFQFLFQQQILFLFKTG